MEIRDRDTAAFGRRMQLKFVAMQNETIDSINSY